MRSGGQEPSTAQNKRRRNVEINVDAVVQEIKKEIEREGCVSDIPSFNEVMNIEAPTVAAYNSSDLGELVKTYSSTCYVIESTPISGNRFVAFIKRIIRKLTRFYVKPIVDVQNHINATSARIFTAIEGDLSRQSAAVDIAPLYERNTVLEMQLKLLSDELDAVKSRLLLLEDENSALKERLK